MAPRLRSVITSADAATRNTALETLCRSATLAELLAECRDLEKFRRESTNLYERVRALFFLYAIHRFHLPRCPELCAFGRVPFAGHVRLQVRRFDEAIHLFLTEQ